MSAFLAGIYLSGGLAVMGGTTTPPPNCYWRFDVNEVRNPYGALAVGWSTDPERRWSAGLEFRHISSVPVHDGGQNTIELRATWRPFR